MCMFSLTKGEICNWRVEVQNKLQLRAVATRWLPVSTCLYIEGLHITPVLSSNYRAIIYKSSIQSFILLLLLFCCEGSLFGNTQNKGFGFSSGLGTGTASGTTGFGTGLGTTGLSGFGGFNIQSTQQQQGESVSTYETHKFI